MPKDRIGVGLIQPVFYWIGIAMSVACLALVLARNTELLGRFEHANIPGSWLAGAAAIAAFLVAEYRPSASVFPARIEPAPEVLQQEL